MDLKTLNLSYKFKKNFVSLVTLNNFVRIFDLQQFKSTIEINCKTCKFLWNKIMTLNFCVTVFTFLNRCFHNENVRSLFKKIKLIFQISGP